MPDVDERIVSMKFDNAQFENGVSTSINSIDKLKASLRFDNVGDGFDSITKSARKVDLSSIQNSIESLLDAVSLKGIAKLTIIQDMIRAIETRAKNLITAVFKAPVDDGFKEYELKMGSVQTIMASTGATLEKVNGYLQDLNLYADKTIYSFSDMTNNIGKFTNAGVSLDKAVLAIKGVSNEAAVSGANANEASRAMYNFAQALSAGYVKLIDWKSIENANMATVEFKQQLIDTAVALGTVVKEGDSYRSTTADANGKLSDLFSTTLNFNDSLSHQWLTTDVLVETLAKYADETTDIGKKAYAAAQDVKTLTQLTDTLKEALGSGWSRTFELIIGDFEESKDVFTNISKALGGIIDRSSDLRNGLVEIWRDNGGRERFISSLDTILSKLESFYNFVDQIGTRIGENLKLLPDFSKEVEDTVSAIDDITEAEKAAAENIALGNNRYGSGQQRIDALEKEGLRAEKVQEEIEKIIANNWEVAESEKAATKQINNHVSSFEDQLSVMERAGASDKEIKLAKTANNIATTLLNVGKALKNIGEAFGNVVEIIGKSFMDSFGFDLVTGDISSASEAILSFTENLKNATKDNKTLKKIFDVVFKIATVMWGYFVKIVKIASDILMDITDGVTNIISKVKEWASGIDENSRLYRAWVAIQKIFTKVVNAIVNAKDQFIEFINDADNPAVANFKNSLSGIWETIKQFGGNALDKIVEFLEFLAEKDITFENLQKFFSDMFTSFSDGGGKVKEFFDNFKDDEGKFAIFSKLSDIISNIFSSDGDKESIFEKAKNWVGQLGSGIIEGLKSISFKDIIEGVKLGTFLAVMWQLYQFIYNIKTITSTFKGSVIGVIDQVANTLKAYQTDLRADAIQKIAIAIAILAASLIGLSAVDQTDLSQAAVSLALVMGMLALIVGMMAKFKDAGKGINKQFVAFEGFGDYKIAAILLGFAVAIATVAKAMKTLVDIDVDSAWAAVRMILAVVAILTVSTGILAVVSKVSGGLNNMAATLIAMSVSIWVMAQAIKTLSKLPVDKAWVAIGMIGVLVLAVSTLAIATSGANSGALAAAALVFVAIALAINLMIPAVAALVALSATGQMGNAVAALTLFVVLTGAIITLIGAAANPITLLAFAASIVILGLALVKVGIWAIPAALGLGILAAALLIFGVLAFVLQGAVLPLIGFADAILVLSMAGVIASVGVLIFAIALKVLADVIPDVATAIVSFAAIIAVGTPTIIGAIKGLISGVVETILSSATFIGVAIVAVLRGILNALWDIKTEIFDEIGKIIFSFIDWLVGMISPMVDGLVNILVMIVYELAAAIGRASGPFWDAIFALVQSIIILLVRLVADIFGRFSEKLGDTIDGYADDLQEDLESRGSEFKQTAKGLGEEIGEGVQEGVDESTSDVGNTLSNNLTTGLNSATSNISNQNLDLSSMFGDGDSYFKTGSANMEHFGDGFMNSVDLKSMAEGMSLDGIDGLTMPDAYGDAATTNIGSWNSAFESNYPQTEQEGREMSEAGANGAQNIKVKQAYARAANSVIDGFVTKLHELTYKVYNAGTDLASAVVDATRVTLSIHSPSRVMMEQGKFVAMGMANGIKNFSILASDATEDMGDAVVESLSSPLDRIVDLLNGNIDYDPTIRPVLDLTQLQSGVSTMNGLFGDESLRLAASNARINAASLNTANDLNSNNQNGSRDVVNAIRELRSDFNELSQKLDSMQVVMDTGALVGQIATPIDNAMGRRQLYKGRRN